MPEWSAYIAAIRAAFPDMPKAVADYLDTFQVESRANHEERDRAFEALDPDTQRRVKDLHAKIDPQLFH